MQPHFCEEVGWLLGLLWWEFRLVYREKLLELKEDGNVPIQLLMQMLFLQSASLDGELLRDTTVEWAS